MIFNQEGTTTGRFTSNPFKVGDRVKIVGGFFKGYKGEVMHDNGGPRLWVCLVGAHQRDDAGYNPRRQVVEKLDVISELGDLVR